MLQLVKTNILDLDVDIVVMSANSTLLAGGGMSGAMHRAAGPELEIAARKLGPLIPGQAVITPGFNLKASYVIHAVAPRFIDGKRDEEKLLKETYLSALSFHDQLPNATSIAFHSMGTGIYRWPLQLAAKISVEMLVTSGFDETYMCVIDQNTFDVYSALIQ